MLRLKQLIHEIHRRSLWQVLGIYVLAGWLALQIVDTLAGALRLPEWAAPVALVLLIIGLPIVLATAFVQEGIGDREASDQVETTAGGTPIPGTGPQEGTHHRLFTWRNALLVGLGAFALWGVVATAWIVFGNPGAEAGVSEGGDGGPIESIAVLKFVNMSEEESNEYFAAGMSEQLLDALSTIPGLRVAARTSSFQFEGENVDVRDVGQRLGVEAVLEGSVRRDRDRVRITAQLVSAEDGFHVWSETYERQMAGVFDLQDEITRAILNALRLQLPGGDTIRLVSAATESVEAYDLYLRARHLWNQRTQEGLERALEYFRQAIALDSAYALAWAGIADTYAILENWGYMPLNEALPLAREAAERALALDETLAEAHAALGLTAFNGGDFEAAEMALRRAIEINPNYASAHQWYASLLAGVGRREEALEESRRAYELDPLSPIISHNLAQSLRDNLRWRDALAQHDKTLELDPGFGLALAEQSAILTDLGRFDEALVLARRAREMNPASPWIAMAPADVLTWAGRYDAALEEALPVLEAFPDVYPTYLTGGLVGAYVGTGRYEEALAAMDRAEELIPPPLRWAADVVRAFIVARAGNGQTALEHLERAEEARVESPAGHWALATIGQVYAALGDRDRAFEWLERAYEKNPTTLSGMRVDPGYDPLRDDPRFDDLLKRMGLDEASLAWLEERADVEPAAVSDSSLLD
jgi:TolB-like protein/Tfp pilus assembly protein PilF